MKTRALTLVTLLALAATLLATPARALDPKNADSWKHWTALKAKFKALDNFSCDLFSWGYQTQHFIDNFPERLSYIPPEKKDTKPPPIPDWRYRIYNLQYQKPDHIMITYKESLNEDTERGSLIDKAVNLVLRHVPGTTLTYGQLKTWEYDDKGRKRRTHGLSETEARATLHPNLKSATLNPLGMWDVFVKFPYISNQKFGDIPVPILYKAAMKIMMIASRKEIYRSPYREMLDSRGYGIKDVAIHRVMDYYEHFSDDGVVTIEDSPRFTPDDYSLDKKTGWLTLKNTNKKNTIKKFLMIPKNTKKSKGITKLEAFFDQDQLLFYGLHEYENGKLVGVMQFMNLKVSDPNVKTQNWKDFFKGRRISETS